MKINKKVKIFTENNPIRLKNEVEIFKETHAVTEIKQSTSNIIFIFYAENEIKREQVKALKKIMIMRATLDDAWYKTSIGKTFNVLKEDLNSYVVEYKKLQASVLKADAAVI